MKTEKKIVGVIGGMGPLATVDLYRKIVEHTLADCDQAHVRTIIDSNTNIPDRTAALLSGGESPVRELLLPCPEGQAALMDMIYSGVKAGRSDYDTAAVRTVLDRLMDAGAQTLILGCTELPPAFEMYDLDYPNLDPTLTLALAAITASGGTVK